MEFRSIRVGTALGCREFTFVRFFFDGIGSRAAVEEAFDISGLHNIESHELGFVNEASEYPMLVSRVRSDRDPCVLRPMMQEWP